RVSRNGVISVAAFPTLLSHQARGKDAVNHYRMTDGGNARATDDAHPHIPIFSPDLLGIESSHLVQNRPSNHDARCIANGISDAKLSANLARRSADPNSPKPTLIGLGVPIPGIAGNEADLGASGQVTDL